MTVLKTLRCRVYWYLFQAVAIAPLILCPIPYCTLGFDNKFLTFLVRIAITSILLLNQLHEPSPSSFFCLRLLELKAVLITRSGSCWIDAT